MSSLGQDKETLWRSEGQLENSPEYQANLYREFAPDASVLEDPMSRRTFIKLMGATAAIAGLSGCSFRKPEQKIYPYVKKAEEVTVGKSLYFATAMAVGEDVVGILAESFEGRPIKIEGNPLHPQSLGVAKSWQQAAVIDLYDPDRLKVSTLNGQSVSKESFEAWMREWVESHRVSNGRGLAILTEAQPSPTFARMLAEVKKSLSEVEIYRYEPINEDNGREAMFALTGRNARVEYDFTKANIILSLDSDFIGTELGNLIYTKQFSSRRDPDHKDGMSRFYAVESKMTLTGGKADHRLKVRPSMIEAAFYQIALGLAQSGLIAQSEVKRFSPKVSADIDKKWVDAVVSDLMLNRNTSVVVVGAQLSKSAHMLGSMLNKALGNFGTTVVARALPFQQDVFVKRSDDSLAALIEGIDAKRIDSLIMIGGNPVYTAPKALNFGKKLERLKSVVHLTHFANETTKKSHRALSRTHFLESWSDVKSLDGTVSIVQPLIAPQYDSISDSELLSYLLGSPEKGYELVRKTWADVGGDSQWKAWLHDGIVTKGGLSEVPISGSAAATLAGEKVTGLEINFVPSYAIYDGRYANNGWLQELPDPVTKLTWDNAALISAKTAKRLKVKTEDVVNLKFQDRTLTAPVMIQPGQPDETITLSLGYGRQDVGRIGENAGVDAFQITPLSGAYIAGVSLSRTGDHYELATTQEHGSLEGRPVYRQAPLSEYKAHPDFAKHMVHHPELISPWEEKKYDTGYQWGMVIDLAKCVGCSACITACQSENNIPIVGKKQVLNAREMHWIRIDRYYEGTEENPQMVQQPVTCLQCEMAPCEQVCPVAATTHSEEGINEMTYNRCVGTRYCANNCPVKVRRFNFFDFHQRNPQAVAKDRVHFFDYFKEPDKSIQKQFNPEVTVRMRGVMEKCTYCIQRINEVKFEASNADRFIQDGEIKTACQQTCPAEAIVFGDIRDENSKVAKLKRHQRDFHLLSELNLKPRTSYLAGITNPHPLLKKVEKKGTAQHV